MSLDPRDNRRRGRSRSPGPREEEGRERSRTRVEIDEYTQTRERSRVRVPSPPSPPSRYEEPKRYSEYEERETVTVRRGDREEERGGRGGYGGGRGGGVSQYLQRDDRDDSPPARGGHGGGGGGGGRGYDLPGKYQATVEEETSVRYESGGGRGGPVREKEYYKETSYGKRDEYGRHDEREPERERERDRRGGYEVEVDKYKYAGDPRDKGRYEEERHGRERGASFNVTAGHSSVSGSIGVGHERHPSYAEPPRHGSDARKYDQPHVPGDYSPPRVGPDGRPYAEPAKWEYAQPGEQISYTKRTETTYGRPASPPQPAYAARTSGSRISSTYDSPRSSKSQVVTVEPGARRRDSSPPGGGGLAPRMHSLSVSTGHHGGASLSLANAPGSPLLEAYHGTYQSISPMPSPLLIASSSHTEITESISPIDSGDEGRGNRKSRRTARFHDPVDEATVLAKALKGEKRAPDTQPLIDILPGLTHDQILDLRVEYKHIVKTGHDKKGVNIAKHIKLRLKEEDPSLMKACYACALGKWESEAYWANFWYQGEKSRRELLIESLMGRTNKEIREIKDGFSDKKYSDSLTKCMKTELKEDKFKKAVLLVLEEKKMEERPGYGVDRMLVEDDVRALHKAVKSEKGGETAMIQIVVVRSDGHLREVLRLYESTYRANFAREMLKKSGNLVVCPHPHPLPLEVGNW